MKKALFVATVVGFIASFEKSDILMLQSMGYEVHYAANAKRINDPRKIEELNNLGVIQHDIAFARNPFASDNIAGYNQLTALMKQACFDLVHCHTPVGGVLGRIAAHHCRVPVVLYTAHGFHFFRGCPLKNRILFYPIEKYMSKFTDILITINQEDFEVANGKFHSGRTERIHGVGIEIDKFNTPGDCRDVKRAELGVCNNEILLLSVGELDKDKNHIEVLKAMKSLAIKGFKYIVAGNGGLRRSYQQYIDENGLNESVKLLGFRRDIPELLQAADIYVFPSLFEGLSVALMEAVAAKMPIVCSEVRGNVDTVVTPESYFDPKDHRTLLAAIKRISGMTKDQKKTMAETNYRNLQKYRLSEVQKEMSQIYCKADEMVEERKKL